MKSYMLTFILCLLTAVSMTAQVSINEYSASNLNSYTDAFGKTEDWIELYNDSETDMDISGYHLSDKDHNPGKWPIPEGTIIPAKGFLTFWCSGRDLVINGDYHTNFKLAQTKGNETLMFTTPDEEIIDQIPMELTLVENSRCKTVDGGTEWMVCTSPTLNASNNDSQQYTGYTATPSMDMEAGYYEGQVTVAITNNEPNSVLRYTTDGTNVTTFSPIYDSSIEVNSTTVIKARSFSNDNAILPGKMDFNTYFIDEDFTLAVFSVASDEVINLANGNGELIPIGSLEYFNLDKEREATSFGSLNRHGQDSWVLPHRSLDWVSRDEMGYSKAVEAELFSYSNRDEYQKFMFRNSGDDNYPAINDQAHQGSTHIRDEYVQTLAQEGGMKLDVRAVERVILFLNGEYWGVYGMRERPVDHDYTDEYYGQDKYNLQYLATWNTTDAEYGGYAAFSDWYRLRDFILENDMSIPENYETVKDQLQVQSLIDYMLVNLNCVASDWLNYNTGWWRGLDPDGDHKKWGYILWDLDATFDYYINYSGVPDISPYADPCDIEEIADFMDGWFPGDPGSNGGPPGTITDTLSNPGDCQTIINGSSPYPADDEIFILVASQDVFCCEESWDNICQGLYNDWNEYLNTQVDTCESFLNGSSPYAVDDPIYNAVTTNFTFCCDNWNTVCENIYTFYNSSGGNNSTGVSGNVGKHEKILLKLIDENPDFKQLYYSRQADLMNTVYSCENMMETLDRMLAVIEPEMPRQIQRWGGSMNQWQQNVNELKNFIGQRCEHFDDGMVDCYDLSGPFNLTLMVEPAGVGEIELNTIDILEFPWSGDYFGNMENKIKAKSNDDNYEFSHWESTSGNQISPSVTDRKATINLTDQDTLIAVFESITATDEIEDYLNVSVYPNPTNNVINIDYELPESMNVNINLTGVDGRLIANVQDATQKQPAGPQHLNIDASQYNLNAGMYFITIEAEKFQTTKRVTIIK